jgi:hypothetical protein
VKAEVLLEQQSVSNGCSGCSKEFSGDPAIAIAAIWRGVTRFRRSRLAGDQAIGICIDHAHAIAGKPAPTVQRCEPDSVGAGLLAMRPLESASTMRTPSLASQLPQVSGVNPIA